MDYDMTTNHIKSLIDNNCLDEAIHLLSHRIERNKEDDEAYYLMGNVYRKQGNMKMAMFYYTSATEINAHSPATEAYRVLLDIRNFINPDYNP